MLKLRNTMTKKLILIAFASISSFILKSQGWNWAINHGTGVSPAIGKKVCTDTQGNVYVAGTYSSSSITFGSFNLSNSGSGDVFVVKYDPQGNVIWANKVGGSGNEEVGGICTDANGKVYLLGSYTSTYITVGPFMSVGNGNTTSNVFIEIIDATGAPVIITSYASTGWDYGYACAYSNSQSALYITGSYDGNSISFSPYNLNNTGGGSDMFLAKLNISGPNITPAWAITTGAVNSYEVPVGLVLDNANSNVYVSGQWLGTVSTIIGSTTLNANNTGFNVFLAKWNSSGAFQWAQNFGSANASASSPDTDNTGLAIDGTDNCYLSGSFRCSILGISTSTFVNTGSFSYDAYVAKFNPSGIFQWAKTAGGSQEDKFTGVAVNGNDIFLSGYFSGTTAVVGTTTLVNTTPAANSRDLLIAKYNSAGVYQWAALAPGVGNEIANGVATDTVGAIYTCGSYSGGVGPVAFGTTTMSSSASSKVFLAKIACLTPSINGVSSLCTGSSATLNALGASSYTWSTNANTNSIVVSPSVNATYYVIGSVGTCTGQSNTFSLSVIPASVNAGPDLSLACGQSQTITVNTVPAGTSIVVWTPTLNLSSPNSLTTTVTNSNSQNTQYTVSVTLNNGCQVSDMVTVSPFVPTPSICMASVDSIGDNNVILWDNANLTYADSIFVYRDIGSNNYQVIGRLKRNTLFFGEFRDTLRSLYAANGDPRASSWRYKIKIKDNCGGLSQFSPYHQTVFIQDFSGNFIWNHYEIEGQPVPVPILTNYLFKRDDIAIGNWQNIQTLSNSSTAFTDPNYASFQYTADWRVETAWTTSCSSSFLDPVNISVKKSKSNVSTNRPVGIHFYDVKNVFTLFPNPSSGYLIVNTSNVYLEYFVVIENLIGQELYKSAELRGANTVNIQSLNPGLYNVKVVTANGSSNTKLVKQ